MTEKQVEKHKEVIRWWLENTDKGVWYFNNDDIDYCFWFLTHTPEFSLCYKYVQNDEYHEFRKAQIEGKIVQYKSLSSQMYREMTDSNFSLHISNYRIKPDESKFKAGDWMINTKTESSFGKESSNPLLVTKDWLEHVEKYGKTYGGNTPYTGDLNNFILWHPKDKEWCVFWNEDMKSYRVAQFKQVGYGRGREGSYKDYQGRYYEMIAPLEFIQTLRSCI